MAFCCLAIFASGVVMTAFVSSPQKYSIDSARWKFASEEAARFIEEQMPGIQQFPDRFALLKYALSDRALQNGLTCEFGVFRGESINYIASVLAQRTIHGFDSFQGNPEDSKDFLGWKKDYSTLAASSRRSAATLYCIRAGSISPYLSLRAKTLGLWRLCIW